MAAVEPIYRLLNIDSKNLSKGEEILLETEIFRLVYEKLLHLFKIHFKPYSRIMKYDKDKEDKMIEENIMRLIINDIVTSEEYNLEGIACYTETPEDIIYEIASGTNTSPSLQLSQKIIALHRSIRSKLYDHIIQQIIHEHMTAATSGS